MTTPTTEPTEARAGTTWEWRREDLSADYPADAGWALTYWFKKTGSVAANFSVVASASGKFFAVSVSAATTQGYAAGEYTWVAQASKAGAIYDVQPGGKGKLAVLPRYDQAANVDDRSHAVKMLEAIEAVLESRASQTQREMVGYAIGNRSQQFDQSETKESLKTLRAEYAWLVDNEEARADIKNGKPNRRLVGVRFNQPGGR